MFELRRHGSVSDSVAPCFDACSPLHPLPNHPRRIRRVAMAGTTGKKFPVIREHLASKIRDVYAGLDVAADTFPADDVERDAEACQGDVKAGSPGESHTGLLPTARQGRD